MWVLQKQKSNASKLRGVFLFKTHVSSFQIAVRQRSRAIFRDGEIKGQRGKWVVLVTQQVKAMFNLEVIPSPGLFSLKISHYSAGKWNIRGPFAKALLSLKNEL